MKLDTSGKLIDAPLIKSIYKKRDPFSHKGDYGFAGIFAGSYGMMGAAVLAAKACLKSGAGKVISFIPEEGYDIMQITVPEAMVRICGSNFIREADDLNKYDAIGIGPGIGIHASHKKLLIKIFTTYNRPLVIDADGLNTISKNKKLLNNIPESSILTPHIKEFERLFGQTKNDLERIHLALQKASQYKIYILLKGHHTLVTTPEKNLFYNATGNAGMATAGSGDVLTGILTGLLAQGYTSLETCLLGVYLHGLSGDIAAQKLSQEALIATDIIDCLGDAFKLISKGE